MGVRLDHLVVLVRDLDGATRDYERLGFRVTPGGAHADGLTENALVPFADGTYLELVRFVDPDDDRDNVWGWRPSAASGGGLIDFCAASDDLEATTGALLRAGLDVEGPEEGGRTRPDGRGIRWLVARLPASGRPLPFLIQDLTERGLRVPSGPETEHPNGATGIAGLRVAVPDLRDAARLYGALAGRPVSGDTARLGECDVRLVGLKAGEGAAGPRAFRLAGVDPGSLSPDLLHGAGVF